MKLLAYTEYRQHIALHKFCGAAVFFFQFLLGFGSLLWPRLGFLPSCWHFPSEDWGMFLQKHRGNSWDAQQERLQLTFTLYDLDGDGMLRLGKVFALLFFVVSIDNQYVYQIKMFNLVKCCQTLRS